MISTLALPLGSPHLGDTVEGLITGVGFSLLVPIWGIRSRWHLGLSPPLGHGVITSKNKFGTSLGRFSRSMSLNEA